MAVTWAATWGSGRCGPGGHPEGPLRAEGTVWRSAGRSESRLRVGPLRLVSESGRPTSPWGLAVCQGRGRCWPCPQDCS